MNGSIDLSILVSEFIEDATGHLDSIESTLLDLEKEWAGGICDASLLNSLLGSLHTLKGNSGMMGFRSIQDYIHHLESVLKSVLDSACGLTPSLFDSFYSSVNLLRGTVASLAEDHTSSVDFSEEIMLLQQLCHDLPKNGEEPPVKDSATPVRESRSDDSAYITRSNSSLKVKFEKLDELLNLVGELVIHRTALHALEGRLREKVQDRELLEAFSEADQLIGKSSAELREAIMKARMLPVKTVFQRFQRLVRDHARSHRKEIRLLYEGEDTELDKTVIDEIGEPLLHLIRNALDHGIELPAERRNAGKPSTGTIRLKARHESNHIVISVEDDGRGIDPARIRNSAVAKGLLGAEEAAALTDPEALQLIFLPGFSTSGTVTETSGRGIGLDVVKKMVSSFNGQIDISGIPGLGTTFTVKLPLTLAIISALMVEVSGQTYAIPLSGVLESIRLEPEQVHDIGSGEMIQLRDRLLPVCRLDRFFGAGSGHQDDGNKYIVVVGSAEKRGGLVVDRLVGQQEIVIKALDEYLGELPGISGGTVLGSGRIAMIIDIDSILSTKRKISGATA